MARGSHETDAPLGFSDLVPRAVERHPGPPAWTATWFDPPFQPEPRFVDQVYGICFDEQGQILLICTHDDGGGGALYWNLPGGGLEPGETLDECLAREVAEEGCATVLQRSYIGCQRGDEDTPAGRTYYQVRFWAQVRLDRWAPQHEAYARTLVPPEQFLGTLAWGSALTAAVILEEGQSAQRSAQVKKG